MTEDIALGRQPRRTGVCLVVGSTVGRPIEVDPRKEMMADEGRLSAKVRRSRALSFREEIVTGRQPRRTGVCLAVGSTVGRPIEVDPRKEMMADEGRLSAKVRR